MLGRRSPERIWPCWLALAPAVIVYAAEQPAAAPEWKFDVLHLKSGTTVRGMLVKETATQFVFQDVRRKPGRATVVFFTQFAKNDVSEIDRLKPAERAVLAARLKALDRSGQGEKHRMEELVLQPAPWDKKPKGALSYSSDHFVLVSNAPEEVVRRAAVRLEQIYAAYTRILPPLSASSLNGGTGDGLRPTTIYLFPTIAEYQGMLKEQGINILNPAYYDPARNQVVCASDVQRLGEDLAQARKQYQGWRQQLREKEAELGKLYKGKVPPSLLQPIFDGRRRLDLAEDKNNRVFEAATQRLFRTLYHEAFHAYLASSVYPPSETAVPRWLNEGLAQIFETAILEAGELRVGHADPERLAQVQVAVRGGELLALAEVLKSGAKQFVVAHATERAAADRHYLASWALAFYLTFERRLLGTKQLDQYVQAVQRGGTPITPFGAPVRQPVPDFEKEFRQYLIVLRQDGTTGKAP